MAMIWFALILLAAIVAAVLGLPRFRSGPAPVVGSAAPEFTLPAQDGASVSLADYRERWVVLYFYPRDKTPGCTLEARNFQRELGEFTRRNVVVLGVSLDSVDSHQDFCQKEGLGFRLLSDRDGRVAAAYASLINFGFLKVASRRTFLIDPNGRIAHSFLSVNPRGHDQEILAALDALTGAPA
jgi:thioredoxin-dependent peroxiredoxin